jgi:choline dehydrogenase-like flavoprotein
MQAVSRLSEPIRELGGRRMKFWTAEAVGGATRINAMLLTRGVPGGFNEWARSFGLVDWGWDQVEPFFRKSENAVGHPDAPHRGHSGPMENRQPPPWLSTVQYYEKAAEAVGLPVERDLNDPRASAQGCFRLDQTIDARSERLSAYRAWLNADIAKERKSRLTVCNGVLASRLEVDAKTKQVTGVHVRYAKRTSDDKDYFVRVRREVIVCSGTMCTPQLLMLRYGCSTSTSNTVAPS